MSNNYFIYSLIMLFGVFISSIAQIILKKASEKKYSSLISEYLNKYVIIAYTILFLATFISVYAYKVIPLSLGTILETTGYIFITIFSVVIFKERINKQKVIALLLIVFGIIIYSI